MAKTVKGNLDKMIETIEVDLYPDRKKNRGSQSWIWILAIVGVIIVAGVIIYFWYRKSKTKK